MMSRRVAIITMQVACLLGAGSVVVTYAVSRSHKRILFQPQPTSWTDKAGQNRDRLWVSVHKGFLVATYKDRRRVEEDAYLPMIASFKPENCSYQFLQFSYRRSLGYHRYDSSGCPVALTNIDVRVPLWFPFVAFLAFPTGMFCLARLRRWRHRRCRRKGVCPRCGYDLTGNESGTCPECGTATNSDK